MPQDPAFVDRIQAMRRPAEEAMAESLAVRMRCEAAEKEREDVRRALDDRLKALVFQGRSPDLDALTSELAALGYCVHVLGRPGDRTVINHASGIARPLDPDVGGVDDRRVERVVVIGHDNLSWTAEPAINVVAWAGKTRAMLGAVIQASASTAGYEACVFPLVKGRYDLVRMDVPGFGYDDGNRRRGRRLRLNVDPGCWHLPARHRRGPDEPPGPWVEAIVRGMVETVEDPVAVARAPSATRRLMGWAGSLPYRLAERVYGPDRLRAIPPGPSGSATDADGPRNGKARLIDEKAPAMRNLAPGRW